MVKDYRFDLIGAYLAGNKDHPQIEMEKLGFNIINWEGVPIADCIIVRIDNAEEIKELPEYIDELNEPYFGFKEQEDVSSD